MAKKSQRSATQSSARVGITESAHTASAAPEPATASQANILAQLCRDPVARTCTLVLFACTFWQVFALGFYLDDWGVIVTTDRTGGAAFSLDRWRASIQMAIQRPGQAPFWFFLTSLLGEETILWHMALYAVNVLLGVLLFRIVRQLAGSVCTFQMARILYLSVLLWFVLPWNATYHFWPTEIPVLLILDLFGVCLLFAMGGWEKGTWAFWLPFAGYLWACVGYEALYFQWIPVALLGATLIWEKRASINSVLLGTSPFIAAQGCAIVWFLVSFRFNAGTSNRIVTGWPKGFFASLSSLPREILRSTPESAWLFVLGFAVWLLMIGGAYAHALSDRSARKSALTSIGRVGACLIGAVVSILAFSLGGRHLWGVGPDARAFLLANFWFVAAVALASTYCWTFCSARHEQRQTMVLLLATIVGGFALLAGHLVRAEEWAQGWRLQQKILAEAPIIEMKKMEPGAAVLVVKPFDFNGVPTLSQYWDVSGAMWYTHPVTQGHVFMVYNHWLGPVKWDGERLAYPDETGMLFRDLYIWKPMERDFFKATTAFRVDQDLSLHPLAQ